MYGSGIDHEDAIWVSNYSYGDLQHIFWGFENLNFMQSNFFCRNNGTTPPCWSKTGNGVKFGLTSSSLDCGSLSARFLFIHSYINKQAKGYILVGSLTRLKTLVYKINGAEYI